MAAQKPKKPTRRERQATTTTTATTTTMTTKPAAAIESFESLLLSECTCDRFNTDILLALSNTAYAAQILTWTHTLTIEQQRKNEKEEWIPCCVVERRPFCTFINSHFFLIWWHSLVTPTKVNAAPYFFLTIFGRVTKAFPEKRWDILIVKMAMCLAIFRVYIFFASTRANRIERKMT